MINLSNLLERSVADDTMICVIGKNKVGETRMLFYGTALEAYRSRRVLDYYWYRDIVNIEPKAKKHDGKMSLCLVLTVFCEYGFKDERN